MAKNVQHIREHADYLADVPENLAGSELVMQSDSLNPILAMLEFVGMPEKSRIICKKSRCMRTARLMLASNSDRELQVISFGSM